MTCFPIDKNLNNRILAKLHVLNHLPFLSTTQLREESGIRKAPTKNKSSRRSASIFVFAFFFFPFIPSVNC